MDRTETYIKMCDCAEIQGLRLERIKKKEWWDEGDFSNYPSDGSNVYAGHYVRLKGSIWLPRQDQLQEIVEIKTAQQFSDKFLGKEGICIEFLDSSVPNALEDYWVQFTSMEQLWLAFVMKEKYNKVWDGERWVNRV